MPLISLDHDNPFPENDNCIDIGSLFVPRIDIHGPNDVVWATGEHRLRVLTPLARTDRSTAGEVDAAARELGIERAQCYRLLRRLRADRTVTALLPGPSGRRAGVRLLNKAVETTIEKAIDEFYLRPNCPTLADLMREIGRRCVAQDLALPSRKAVTQRVAALDPRELLRRRRGARHARRKLGRIAGHLTEERPLGLVQVDHTLADIMVVSAIDRRPLDRPWLTLAIDVATRVVTGFHLSLEPPSALGVALVNATRELVLPHFPCCGSSFQGGMITLEGRRSSL